MNDLYGKSKRINALLKFAKNQGFKNRNQLIAELPGDRGYWYKRLNPDRAEPLELKHLQQIVSDLRLNGKTISKEEEEELYLSALPKNEIIEVSKGFLRKLFVEANYLELVKEKNIEPSILEEFILDKLEDGKLRAKAFEAYFSLGFPVNKRLSSLFDDSSELVQKAALEGVIKYRFPIEQKTLRKLIASAPTSVAKRAVDAAKYLIDKRKLGVEILLEADNNHTEDSYYVRARAVKAIIELDPPSAVGFLYSFRRVVFHETIRAIREYFIKRQQQGRLQGDDYLKAIELLNIFRNNENIRLSTQSNIDKTIEQLIQGFQN